MQKYGRRNKDRRDAFDSEHRSPGVQKRHTMLLFKARAILRSQDIYTRTMLRKTIFNRERGIIGYQAGIKSSSPNLSATSAASLWSGQDRMEDAAPLWESQHPAQRNPNTIYSSSQSSSVYIPSAIWLVRLVNELGSHTATSTNTAARPCPVRMRKTSVRSYAW